MGQDSDAGAYRLREVEIVRYRQPMSGKRCVYHVDVTGLYHWLLFVVRPAKRFLLERLRGISARRRLCGCRCRH
jgi:hypothetical protein